MPIKKENLHLYPKDWPQVRRVSLARAHFRCQHDGCTAEHYAVGTWEIKAGAHVWQRLGGPYRTHEFAKQSAAEIHWSRGEDSAKPIVIVLTIAHLNHDPTDSRPENLAAMCQRHHLQYDQHHHNQSAYMTRKAKANTLELPL